MIEKIHHILNYLYQLDNGTTIYHNFYQGFENI